MRGLDSLIKNHQWQLEEKKNVLVGLRDFSSELHEQIQALDDEMKVESRLGYYSNTAYFGGGNYVRRIMDRREQILRTLAEVKKQIEDAEQDVNDAYKNLEKYRLTQKNHMHKHNLMLQKIEEKQIDEMTSQRYHLHQSHTARNKTSS